MLRQRARVELLRLIPYLLLEEALQPLLLLRRRLRLRRGGAVLWRLGAVFWRLGAYVLSNSELEKNVC